MAKKRKSLLEKEYNKQRRRLEQAIARSEKQGYIFPEDILPQKPKRITQASIKRLARLKPEDLRKKSEYLIEETGEVIPYKGNKNVIKQYIKYKKEKIKSSYKQVLKEEPEYLPSFSENVIQRFKSYILGFPPAISEMVMPLINTIIQEQGIEDVSIALENMPQQFHEYLHRHKFDSSGAVSEFATSLIEYLPNASLQYKKDLMDRFEYNELGYTVDDEEA